MARSYRYLDDDASTDRLFGGNQRHKIVSPASAGAILNLQGAKMGRPSHVHVSIGVENGDITSVRVGGENTN